QENVCGVSTFVVPILGTESFLQCSIGRVASPEGGFDRGLRCDVSEKSEWMDRWCLLLALATSVLCAPAKLPTNETLIARRSAAGYANAAGANETDLLSREHRAHAPRQRRSWRRLRRIRGGSTWHMRQVPHDRCPVDSAPQPSRHRQRRSPTIPRPRKPPRRPVVIRDPAVATTRNRVLPPLPANAP